VFNKNYKCIYIMDNPDQFYQKLNTCKEKFYSILDDFKNSYINYQQNPNYNEYEQIYKNNENTVQTLQSDLDNLNNLIQNDVSSINSHINHLNKKINSEKDKKKKLKKQLSQVESQDNGADLMIEQYKENYNIQLLSNVTIVIGIIIIIILLFYIFRPPTVNNAV